MRHWLGSIVTAALLFSSCSRGMEHGECRFHAPDQLISVTSRIEDTLTFAKRRDDPNALYLIYGAASMDGTVMAAIRVDLVTGAQSEETFPGWSQTGGGAPEGWVEFASDEPISRTAHPLIRQRVLRVEFKGTKTTTPAIGRDFGESRTRIGSNERYNGTRRIVFGSRVLLEQDLRRYDHVPSIMHTAAVEPDGDRIACVCADTATRVGIFHRSRLGAAPQSK